MSDKMLPKEQVEALEKILGVKLPKNGFTIEIKAHPQAELADGQLDAVAGGMQVQSMAPATQQLNFNIPMKNWSAKI